MTFSTLRRLVLGCAGLTALSIGLAVTLMPEVFYASYGIALVPQPNLMSELRAPGANLAVLGALILAGALYQKLARSSAILATAVFFAFASGRIVSIILDGWPTNSVLAALGIEVVLGALCLVVIGQQRRKAMLDSSTNVAA